MASIGKPKIRLSAKDLKQAVLKKNKSLEVKNKSLESSIKAQEKQLKFLEKEYNAESKKLSKLLIDVEFQEDRFKKIKGGVYSTDRLLKSKLEKVSKAEKELCGYESAVEKLDDEKSLIKKEIEALEFYKEKCSVSKIELAGIQTKKDNAFDELDGIKAKIDQLYVDYNSKVLSYEDKYNTLEEKAKSHEDMVCRLEQRLFETEDQFKDEENKLIDLLAKAKKQKEKADDELQATMNLTGKTEDEYIKWEQKIAKAKATADKEIERNKNAVEQFKKWKIGVLEEVARLKLKSKVENIDKAGLSEILNG